MSWGVERSGKSGECGVGEAITVSQESLGMSHCTCSQNSSVLLEQEWVSEGNVFCSVMIGRNWAIYWPGEDGFWVNHSI